ncbi:hypothetical protein ABK040_015106 [Willaertia magna]
MSLNDDCKVIIVTGGASGIGKGCVQVFLKEYPNSIVFSLDRNEKTNSELLNEFSNYNKDKKRLFTLICDVSNHQQMEQCIQQISEQTNNRIDVLINNAGVHPPNVTIEDYSIQQFNDLLNLNLTSAYAMSKFCFKALKETKGSTIINIASMVGVFGQANAIAYCSSKAGMIGFTKALAIDAAKFGIRVNAVSPSNVMTATMIDWLESDMDSYEEKKKAMENVQKLKRMATPEEIANVVLFLASDKSSFITGQNIQVDGGASLDYY